ncbi:hypothetical protein BB561_005112 [Smittium simulii]|uniref:Methylmalonyl-CoA epimerase, mitochondrial n=1 Tax=Smittium simulii TaxID=133385 RepID=A0A2T9YC90_9FUNG|nr:hypothetical protein BB561_005112 [Smittium simulii]
MSGILFRLKPIRALRQSNILEILTDRRLPAAFSSYSTDTNDTSSNKLNYMQLGNLNHVAIATKDATKARFFYETVLGAKPDNISKKTALPEHGVYTIFINVGNTKIELLEPLGKNSPISKFLEQNPNGGIHHICLNVKDINKAVEQVKQHNVRVLGDIKIGAHGVPVVFLHPKDCNGVLVELEQAQE